MLMISINDGLRGISDRIRKDFSLFPKVSVMELYDII